MGGFNFRLGTYNVPSGSSAPSLKTSAKRELQFCSIAVICNTDTAKNLQCSCANMSDNALNIYCSFAVLQYCNTDTANNLQCSCADMGDNT